MTVKNRLKQLVIRLMGGPPATLASQAAYALWADGYPPHAHNPFMALDEALIARLLPDVRGLHVLDLACGSGRYARLLRERGAAAVEAADNSAPMLRAGAVARGVCASFEALPYPAAAFDGVVCALAIGHTPRLNAVTAEIARVLRPGGWAILTDVHPFQALRGAQRTFTAHGTTYAVEHHIHLFADYFAAAAAHGLRVARLEEHVPDGPARWPLLCALVLEKPARQP
jgi:malonyl-CoA O-methyltransferase